MCTGITALDLAAVGGSFLLAVLYLDMFWVKLPEERHNGDIAPTLRRQSRLNVFVAIDAGAATVMLTASASASRGVTGRRLISERKRPTPGTRRVVGVPSRWAFPSLQSVQTKNGQSIKKTDRIAEGTR